MNYIEILAKVQNPNYGILDTSVQKVCFLPELHKKKQLIFRYNDV